jgi:RND family efflux transporter MFP subunit
VTSRMTRHPLAVAVALALAACSHEAEAPKASGATPPPLPDDVRTVAAVASPSAAVPAPPEGAASSPGGTAVDARAPETGPLALTGEFVSLVRSDLVPRTGGRVGRVFVDEGRVVSKGQPLLELETDYLRLDLARADADVKRADAAALDARRDLERKAGLAQKGSVAQSTFDRSQSAADQAAAAQAAARANLDLARQRIADAVLRSPVDGVVAERRTDVGERLTEGTVAFVVEQTAPLKLRFRVPERYLGAARTGLAVRATVDAYPGQAFEGKVSVVGGSVDPPTRTFLVEAEFPNRDRRLRPGQFARVEVGLAGR